MAIVKLVKTEKKSINSKIIENEINYLTNPESNPNQIYGGYNFVKGTPEQIIQQFYALNNIYLRKSHIPIRHIIISFDSYYEYFILPYQASIIADELCRDVFAEEYQVIYGIHENTSNLHAHIIINTVSFVDGHLLPWDYNTTNKIYESLKLILYRYRIWYGNFPIKNLKMVFTKYLSEILYLLAYRGAGIMLEPEQQSKRIIIE